MKFIVLILSLASFSASASLLEQDLVGRECELTLDKEEEPLKKLFYVTRHDAINNYLVLTLYSLDPQDPMGIQPGILVEGEKFGFDPSIKLATQGDEVFAASIFLSVNENGLTYLELRLDNKTGEMTANKRLTQRPRLDSGLLDSRSPWFKVSNCEDKIIKADS